MFVFVMNPQNVMTPHTKYVLRSHAIIAFAEHVFTTNSNVYVLRDGGSMGRQSASQIQAENIIRPLRGQINRRLRKKSQSTSPIFVLS
jgi:ABC-type sugar transport system ATPase subunit